MFTCHNCNCNFSVATAYICHIKSTHSQDPKFQYVCGFNNCPKLSKNFHIFKKHLFQHKEINVKPVLLTCATCSFHSVHKRKFISHFKSHSIIECPVSSCSRSYTVFSSFTSHLSRYHPTYLLDSNLDDEMQIESFESESDSVTYSDMPGSSQENEKALLQRKISLFILRLQEHFYTCDIQLAMICKSTDVKEFGFNTILAPLLKDLKILEESGITLDGIPEKVKGTLVAIVGDNLASHEVGGYTTNFSSKKTCICRFCMATYDDRMNQFKAKCFTRRTKQIHEHHINLIDLDDSYIKLYGLKWDSPLNDLKYFHTSTMLPPDAMHDLLEGIVPLELSLIIKSLIKSKFISLPLLNRRIRTLKFGFNDKPNKPYELNENFAKGITMTASRMWSLLRFLPLMIGNFVPKNEIIWEFLLMLKDMVDIILSPTINFDYISLLSELIHEHHTLFKKLFKDVNLKPKHHFLVHYPQLILQFGPLVHFWSMRFEAKHLYFKRVAQISKNTKDLAFTLSQRHQQLQCLYNSPQRRVLGGIVALELPLIIKGT